MERPASPSLIPSHTLAALEALDRAHPATRKLLVAPSLNWGRDLLLTLARRTGGWAGWEVATLRTLAGELALTGLDRTGTRIAGDMELLALTGRALDEAIAAGETSREFAALAGGLGFRAAVRDALLEARTAGVTPARIREAAPRGAPARSLAAVLERYERRLAALRLADPAATFAAAATAFGTEARFVLAGAAVVALAPDLGTAGLPGALLRRLLEAGARPLPADPVEGTAAPERSLERVAAAAKVEPWALPAAPASPLSWLAAPPAAPAGESVVRADLFWAATPSLEVREALRRALAEGWRWDEVELVTTDPDTYGIALDAVCRQTEIGWSALHGVPLARTRLGRALARWLDWIGDGLPADLLREALEAGDLGAPDDAAAPTALARLLRQLEIGWGRERYVAALVRLRDPGFAERVYRRDEDDDDGYAERVASRRDLAGALAALLERLLASVPEVPERGSDRAVHTTLPALARATRAYLDLVPLHGTEGEAQTRARLESRLAALGGLDDDAVRFPMALAQLRDALSDLRAWTALSDDRKPWSPAGGRVHLTDLAHAGLSGRPRTFVLGLDADRTGGSAVQDPLLNDGVRRALEADGLPTTSVRREERAYRTLRALARLRGTVTLSFAAAGDDGERAAGPAQVMLQALRVIRRDPSLDYRNLREALGAPACAVPAAPARPLDARDVWLGAIGAAPLLLDGERAVRAAWAPLAEALLAVERRDGRELSELHGLVPAAGRLDPRVTGEPVSATALELLGKCPMAWFYQKGLRVRPPSDPAYDPDAWLDAAQRGSLLHSVYERVGRAFHGRRAELAGAGAEAAVLAIADALLAEYRDTVPPPSESVFDTEAAEIRASAVAFLAAERAAVAGGGAEWEVFELDLGVGGPTSVPLDDGRTVPVHGRVDRVDALPDRSLVVIDFKTGRPNRFERDRKDGPFKGGRLLQAAVYAAAVEARLGRVRRFEYRFPTLRGENRVVAYRPDEIAAGRSILGGLLDHIGRGEFIATNESADCGWCDYQAICRASRDDFHRVASPRAAWAAEHGAAHAAYGPMIARRSPGGDA